MDDGEEEYGPNYGLGLGDLWFAVTWLQLLHKLIDNRARGVVLRGLWQFAQAFDGFFKQFCHRADAQNGARCE